MQTVVRDVWYIAAPNIQFSVNDRATKKEYDFYVNKDSGTVYFTKKWQAKKIAKFLELDPKSVVYHTPLEFLVN